MDELSDYTSPVIEFKALNTSVREFKLIDSCTSTDSTPDKTDASVETNKKCSKESQTEVAQNSAKDVDEQKLATWLKKIYADMEKELLKGCTPVLDSYLSGVSLHDLKIQPYQKLSVAAATNSQGLAIWLSVFTNNAPVLVVTTVAPHDDWCEHVEQNLKLFVPKRVPNGNFISYNEEKSIPLKACLRSLCTNPFNKHVFAGSTYDGDIYVWQYEQLYNNHTNNRNTVEIKEIYYASLPHGYAVELDWCNEFTLLTAHSNGLVAQWHLGKEIAMEAESIIKNPVDTAQHAEICALLALSVNNFVVGTKDGSVFHCMTSNFSAGQRHLEIVSLKKHLFMISTLLRTNINGYKIVISCDLSGEIYFHDLRNSNDDADTAVMQIPLPFTSTITSSNDGNIIYSPGDDGSLECYRVCNGSQMTVKGALKGKGNFIKSSDNGCWIITGLYGNEFQVFSIED